MTRTVSNDELFCLLSCSVRYALGRKSYVVGEVSELAVKYAPELNPQERAVLIRDIRSSLEEAKARGETLGMAMDHEEWQKCLKKLEAL